MTDARARKAADEARSEPCTSHGPPAANRYYLAELDSQSELLRLILSEGNRRPDLLADASRQLLSLTYESFAEWLADLAGDRITDERARAATVIGLGALIASRLTGDEPLHVEDDVLVATWTDMMVGLIGG